MTALFGFIGFKLINFFIQTYHMFGYFTRCVSELRHVYFYRRQIVGQCYAIGVDSLSLVILVSAFSGMAVSIQMAYQMEDYVPDYMVGSIVVRSVVLELAPIQSPYALLPLTQLPERMLLYGRRTIPAI